MERSYRKMYAILCGAVSDALDALPELPETMEGKELLWTALTKAEELYLEEKNSG